MFKTELSSLVCSVRDLLCPRQFRPDADGWWDGILFHLTVELSHYTDEKNESRRTGVRFLLCGNTSVFTDVDPLWNQFKLADCRFWANSSNHDSCWRDAVRQVLNDVYFQMADNVAPDVAPALLHDHSKLGWLEDPWWLVKCRVSRDKTDPHGYRRILEEVVRR